MSGSGSDLRSGPRLDGRAAIVTGGSRGIGLAIAEALLAQGASVLITARREETLAEAVETLGPGACGFVANAADESAAEACVRHAISRFGRVDVLVNNAGANPAFGPLVELDRERFQKTVDVNLWAPILWSSLAWRAWMEAHGGSIVNVSSIGGLVAGHGTGAYRASKAALIHLTRQMALEMAPSVRVNAVAPGLVRTRMAEALWKPDEAGAAARTLAGRLGEPGDVGAAVAFLAGESASWITGETLVVDGGQVVAASASRHGESTVDR